MVPAFRRRSTRTPVRYRSSAGAVAVTALWMAAACTSNTAPPGFLPEPAQAGSDVYGSWMDVTVDGVDGRERIRGELLAVDPDTAWILSASGVRRFPTRAVVDGQLVAYDSAVGDVSGAVLLGVLSTVSNGAFLILTAPMWAIGGSIAAGSQSRLPLETLPAASETLAPFARFPGGMPPGLDTSVLRPRPRR